MGKINMQNLVLNSERTPEELEEQVIHNKLADDNFELV